MKPGFLKKEYKVIIFLILICIYFILRFNSLDADPAYVSWSKGIIFDPAIYSLNLKNCLLTGSPYTYQNNYYLFFPFHYFLQKCFFKFISYNYFSLNFFSVLLNLLTTLLLFLILKNIYDLKYSFFVLFLITFSFVNISYSKISYVETSMLFVVMTALYFYFTTYKYSKFISGAISFLAVITKLNSVIIIVVIVLYEIYLIIFNKKKVKYLMLYLSGFLIAAILFVFLFLYPNFKLYKELLNSKIFYDVISSHSPKNIFQCFKINNFFNTNIFYKIPFVFLLTIIFFSSNLFKKDKLKVFYFLWLIISILLINMSDYTPFRYRYILIPLIFITASVSIVEFGKISINVKNINFLICATLIINYVILFSNKIDKIYLLILFVLTLLCIKFQKKIFTSKMKYIFLFLFLVYNIIFYFRHESSKTYLIKKFNETVYKEISKNTSNKIVTIAGYGSPVFCINAPVKVINLKNVTEKLINNFNIKYLIVRQGEFNYLKTRKKIRYEILYNQQFKKYNESIYFIKILRYEI